MVAFYEAYADGESPVEALREPQLRTIASQREKTATLDEPLAPPDSGLHLSCSKRATDAGGRRVAYFPRSACHPLEHTIGPVSERTLGAKAGPASFASVIGWWGERKSVTKTVRRGRR